MKIKFTTNFPFGKFIAISLLGKLYTKKNKEYMINNPNQYFRLVQHEATHWLQQKEMGIIFFFIWYIVEWIFKIFTGAPYRNLGFEREARVSEVQPDIYRVVAHIKKDGKKDKMNIYNNGRRLSYNIGEVMKKSKYVTHLEFIPTNGNNYFTTRKHYAWLKYIFKSK